MTYGAHAWPTPTRRALLLAAAGATLLGACGDPEHDTAGRTRQAPPTDPEEHTIFDLTLDIVDRFRPVELVAPGFVAHQAGATSTSGLHRHDSGPAAPYAAVVLDVASVPADGSVAAGLATADGEHVLVRWSARSGGSPSRCGPAAAPACCATGSCRRRAASGWRSRSARTR